MAQPLPKGMRVDFRPSLHNPRVNNLPLFVDTIRISFTQEIGQLDTDHFYHLCSQFGDVKRIFTQIDNVGFVVMSSFEQAFTAANTLDGQKLFVQEHPIRIKAQMYEEKIPDDILQLRDYTHIHNRLLSLFRLAIDIKGVEDKLINLFSLYGKVTHLKVYENVTHILFDKPGVVSKCIDFLNGLRFYSSEFILERSKSTTTLPSSIVKRNLPKMILDDHNLIPSNAIHIHNLPASYTDEELMEFLKEHHFKPTTTNIPLAEFESIENAVSVIAELNGFEISPGVFIGISFSSI